MWGWISGKQLQQCLRIVRFDGCVVVICWKKKSVCVCVCGGNFGVEEHTSRHCSCFCCPHFRFSHHSSLSEILWKLTHQITMFLYSSWPPQRSLKKLFCRFWTLETFSKIFLVGLYSQNHYFVLVFFSFKLKQYFQNVVFFLDISRILNKIEMPFKLLWLPLFSGWYNGTSCQRLRLQRCSFWIHSTISSKNLFEMYVFVVLLILRFLLDSGFWSRLRWCCSHLHLCEEKHQHWVTVALSSTSSLRSQFRGQTSTLSERFSLCSNRLGLHPENWSRFSKSKVMYWSKHRLSWGDCSTSCLSKTKGKFQTKSEKEIVEIPNIWLIWVWKWKFTFL